MTKKERHGKEEKCPAHDENGGEAERRKKTVERRMTTERRARGTVEREKRQGKKSGT